ncbi:hypothetical protein HYE59_05135 [Aggregatibacter actinomycetemcomitans]|uniref:hypothetical protein n=1 Tax=Aggregatibacter actinomycetemcomitans TaxID=714 RepID=UPI00197B6BB8|nr:hypothetical protein [Aggregatibacter actinomycetemcomitans]MBN6076932.1 hypothetical protein [Aggregatibacter actinomycetemcomitans]
MKKIFLIFLSFLFLFSCGNGVKKLNDEYLGSIKKNQLYNTVIFLPGGKVDNIDFIVEIFPNDAGLRWEAEGKSNSLRIKSKNYNKIMIQGMPYVTGTIYIDFDWWTYGTNMSTGKHFKKRYILKVEE